MKKIIMSLCAIVYVFFCDPVSAQYPPNMMKELLKQNSWAEIKEIHKLCKKQSKIHKTPPMSYMWNIAMESDFNAHYIHVNEKTKYICVGALSFTKTTCIMLGLFNKHDSWEVMKLKAKDFSKRSLLNQMEWIFAYYDWQIWYRLKCKYTSLSEFQMRMLTFYPKGVMQKSQSCIVKLIDPETFYRNPTYDIDKDEIITLLEIEKKYMIKKKMYVP